MKCRAVMAMVLAAGLLAACGSGQAGTAPGTGSSSTAAPPAARHATLANNGKVLTLAVGGQLTLTLPAPAGWHWTVQKPGGGVLRPESPAPAGATAAFHAVEPGTTVVHAAEVPPCAPHCPAGRNRGPSFVVGVRVQPAAA